MKPIGAKDGKRINRRDLLQRVAAVSGAGLWLTGCASEPKKPAEPPPPPEPVSALKAFTSAFGKARARATDLEILHISNMDMQTVKSEGGKCGAWQFQFVSPSQGQVYNVRYAVTDELPTYREGAWDSGAQRYDARGLRAKPFATQALRCDSTKAYELAAEAAKDFVGKNPDLPVNFLLEQTNDYALPMWRVYWGATVSAAQYSVYIDANQSKVVKKGKG